MSSALHRNELVSSSPSSSSSDEDDLDISPDLADIEEGAEALAMQFYRIELAEQRRLMGVMEHHSKESSRIIEDTLTQTNLTFPFSITAGIEKGSKNRLV
jgi:protein-tyrosine phosphatase